MLGAMIGVAPLLLAAALLAPAEACAAEFLLEVKGSPALAFTATCDIVRDGGRREQRRLKGLVPKRYQVRAAALDCAVRKEDAGGRLAVRLKLDGRLLAAAETGAPFNSVRVRSNGPWGSAKGTVGSVPTPFMAPGAGPLVPPLSGPLIPPIPPVGP